MRILHTAANYRRDCHGVSGIIRDLVDALSDAGHEVSVMAPDATGVRRENGVMRVKMDSSGEVDARTLTRARGLKPDVIHIHDPVALSGPALTLAERLEVPVVYTLHGPRKSSEEFHYRQAHGRVAEASDLVIAPAAGWRRWAGTQGHPRQSMVIAPGLQDLFLTKKSVRDKEREARQLGDHDFVVGLSGSDRKHGALDAFLEAMVRLMEESPFVRLLLTGTRSFRQRVSRRIPAEIRDRAVISEKTGKARKLRRWMDALDLLAAPSARDPEGRHALRAMARRVPVLAPTRAPWTRELSEGETGFLSRTVDADGFYQGLQRARRQLRRDGGRVGEAAHQLVRGRTLERVAAQHVAAYEGVRGDRERIDGPLVAPKPDSILVPLGAGPMATGPLMG